MNQFNVDTCHERIMLERKPLLAFDENADYEAWREAVRAKLTEALGDMPEKCEEHFQIEWEKEHDTFHEYRILFYSEEHVEVPCHLWVPKEIKWAAKPCPVVICLQGHSSGMHISMGKAVREGDEETLSDGDRDFAPQIIAQGYAALILEQRGFGERRSDKEMTFWGVDMKFTCNHAAMVAMHMGRTLLGERVWDISRAIDMLAHFAELDMEKIAVMGNSGGGTAAFYAACMDERIQIVMPSCSVCNYNRSITAMRHCACNYLPGIAKYVDMGDLACLIAPRKLVMVSGELDKGFAIDGAKSSYSTIEKVYAKAGVKDNCRMVIGKEGHRFYAEQSWPVFRELSQW